jgi:hypothetical protein
MARSKRAAKPLAKMLWSTLLSGLFAGLVAVGVTVAIERWGGRLGGVLGTMPTTIVPAALGIFSEAPAPEAFAASINSAPAGMMLNVLFLLSWRVIPPRLPARLSLGHRLAAMTAISLSAWTLAAIATVLTVRSLLGAGVPVRTFGVVTTAAIVLLGVGAMLRPLPAPRGSRWVSPATLAARGLFAACSVGAAVVLASLGHPLVAGVAAVFPAIFLTAMVALWLAQGQAVPAGAVGPMMLGSSAVAAFCVAASFTMPALGPVFGTAGAWLIAVSSTTLPFALLLGRKR